MFFDPVVSIPKPTWRRMQMLVGELSYMQDGEELRGLDLETTTEKFIQKLVDEYTREYFEESTRAAAALMTRRHENRQRRFLE